VASFDPLRLYLREVSRYSALSSTEEQRLLALAAEGDAAAEERLRDSLLKFVADIAMQSRPGWMDPLDAIVEGNLALQLTLRARPSGDLHAAIRNAIEERLRKARPE